MADVFRGSSLASIEDTGRFKLPGAFKDLIDAELGEGAKFFITSVDGKKAQLFPIKEWEQREATLATLPLSSPVRVKFQQLAAYYGALVTMDKQGRIQLPPVLRTAANLKGEAVVLGMAGKLEPGYLEVMNHEMFKQEMKPFTEEDHAALAALGL